MMKIVGNIAIYYLTLDVYRNTLTHEIDKIEIKSDGDYVEGLDTRDFKYFGVRSYPNDSREFLQAIINDFFINLEQASEIQPDKVNVGYQESLRLVTIRHLHLIRSFKRVGDFYIRTN